MTANPQNQVTDLYQDLFKGAGAGDWTETREPAEEIDLVRTGPGDGWPTFQEIMDQVPESKAKEAAAELRAVVRRTPIRVCWDKGASVNPVLVCPPRWRRVNLATYKRARELLLFRGAGEVIEAYMFNLLPTPEEVDGEIWGRV